MTGSAEEGEANINAATTPRPPITTDSAFLSMSIFTDAPFGYRDRAALLGASVWAAKLLHLCLL